MNLAFETALDVATPREQLFRFLADPRNLNACTPPWFSIRIASSLPMELEEGVRIRYRFRLRGLPLPWESEMREWDPPHRFTYVQLRGPYRSFRHVHLFTPLSLPSGAMGTRVVDQIHYHPPGGLLVDRLWVRKQLVEIFRHRDSVLRERFGSIPDPAPPTAAGEGAPGEGGP